MWHSFKSDSDGYAGALAGWMLLGQELHTDQERTILIVALQELLIVTRVQGSIMHHLGAHECKRTPPILPGYSPIGVSYQPSLVHVSHPHDANGKPAVVSVPLCTTNTILPPSINSTRIESHVIHKAH